MSGGRAPTDPGSFFTTPNGEQVALEGGRGNVSDLGNLPEVTDMGTPGGRSGIQAAIDAAVNAINSPTGQTALDLASLTGYGAIPAAAAKIAGRLGGRLGFGGPPAPEPTVETLNETLSGALRGSTPEAQQQFAQQRSSERAPDLNEPREDVAPTSPPPGIAPTVSEAEGGTGVSGSTSGPAGEASGTGAPGAGAGDSGAAGAPGDYGRGGLARRGAAGSFKNAKKLSGGGPSSE